MRHSMLVQEEPVDVIDPLERSMMRAIGMEKGKPFAPDARMKGILSEAARLGGAMARANASLSNYTKPVTNADGSVDIYFGPEAPEGTPGKGWFPFFPLYGPTEPYFDKTWKLDDIVNLP